MPNSVNSVGIAPRDSRGLIRLAVFAALFAAALPFAGAQTETTGGGGVQNPATNPAPAPAPAGGGTANATGVVVRNPSADANLLYYAAQGDVPKFQRFVQLGGSVQEARRSDGKSVLMLAANRGSMPIVQIALRQNVDVNASDKTGFSALMLASRAGHVDIVSELIKAGATVENRNVNGMTALMLAVQAQKPEVVDLLLANGANANTKDNWGNTPLMMAAGGQPKIVQSLLKAGANVNVRNSIGKTALGLAVAKKNESVAAQIRTAGGFE